MFTLVIRVTHGTDDCKAEKKKRITSTPLSSKRRRTAAILEEEGSDLQPGPWTLEESCLLDSVVSFILNTCVIPRYRNICILYNFVSKSLRGNNETAKSVKSLGLKDNSTNQIRMKIYSEHIQTAWVETKTVKK